MRSFFAAFARTAFTGESEQSMFHFWEMISYIANTLIFLLSGVVIAESILRSHDKIEGRDWSYLLLLYIFVQLSRVAVVGLLYPSLKYFGYGIDWKEAAVLVWAGLRGAVALSLSLEVSQYGQHDAHAHITLLTEARFVFLTGGVVFLTLIINGSTTQFLLHHLNMNTITETKSRVLEFAKYEMYSKALEAFGELGEDEELGPADWNTIRRYVSCLSNLPDDGKPTHPHGPPGSEVPEGEHIKQQMQDTRIRFLNGVQAAYWSMLEEGRITQTAALLLMQSVDEALDQVENHSVLPDWEGLRSHVRFPRYLKYLSWRSTSLLSRRASTFFLVQRLELACYIAAAFLRAHRMTRNHLRDFIGESDVAEAVIEESEKQGQSARQFLEDVRLSFPQVLRAVKTKQVTHAILVHLTEYVKSLENAGLLESKETHQLHDAVQVDLKKLLRKPPVVEMPTVEETLRNQPFFGALPAFVQGLLLDAAKEHMQLRSNVIYKEDMRPDGIWLIANGVVKWNSKATTGQRLREPTFSHGSTLGLYETLTGKPYLCDIVTDSVVHSFFIERSQILLVQKEKPELEDFLWQESALAVAKIVLALQFEKATLQEMRALVMEGSFMRIFLRGEIFELRYKEIGILLEGFVKQEDSTDIITAPAGLTLKTPLPSPEDSTRNVSLQEATCFHAEARSRVLFFDMGLSTSILSPGSAQLLALPRKTSRPTLRRSLIEHDTARLQWPSRGSKTSLAPRANIPKRHSISNEIGAGSDISTVPLAWDNDSSNIPDKYSARALEISVFGSQVDHNERPEDGSFRVTRSHENLVNRMSMLMLDTIRPDNDSKLKSTGRRKIASHNTNLGVSLPFVPLKTHSANHESSDDSDKEEHIVKIDSPSALFHSSRPDQS
ncbi:hypothetical protein KC19_5G019200 [Ceratodon purpureus]|uniref:Cyclic nucleotide-binding domain-containing protein n=1 Tax=Ceratodon purpureus TaxID=3225 RepID=A0A8T0HXN9_CERPU|nr:hypothetical protein KC19_5G019200 [Ceratodon purpureus]